MERETTRAVGDASPPSAQSHGVAGQGEGRRRTANTFAARLMSYWTFVALVILLVTFAFTATNFYSRLNWIATSTYATGFLALSVGQTYVIISGGIDLSVGGNLAMSGMAAAMAMRALENAGASDTALVLVGVAVGLLVGTAVGIANGILVARVGITPIVVTLGTLGVTRGATNLLNGGIEVANISPAFKQFSRILGGWITPLVLVSIVVAVVGGVVLAKTRFGLRTYALGSNREAARRAGITVADHLIRVYAICGFLAGLSGLMLVARFGVAETNLGQGAELTSIAAVVIGGTSIFGGKGGMSGTIVGVAIMSALVTGLILTNVQPFWQQVATGGIIIAAVYIDRLRDRIQLRVHDTGGEFL